MDITTQEIDSIVAQVLAKVQGGAGKPAAQAQVAVSPSAGSLGVFEEVDAAVDAAWRAGRSRWPLSELPLSARLPGLLAALAAPGAEARLQYKWEKSAALLARIGAQLRLLSSSASNGSAFVQQMVNLAIVILGVWLISAHELTMGGLIACTMLASRAMAPIGQVAGLLVQYHTASTALTSLDGMMKRQVERPDDAA